MDAAVRPHIAERDEDEGALAHAGMGDDAFGIVAGNITEQQQVHIDAARSEAQGGVRAASPSQKGFFGQQGPDKGLRCPVRCQGHAYHLVMEPGLLRIVLRFGQIDPGEGLHPDMGEGAQPFHSQVEHMGGIGGIGSQTDKDGDGRCTHVSFVDI